MRDFFMTNKKSNFLLLFLFASSSVTTLFCMKRDRFAIVNLPNVSHKTLGLPSTISFDQNKKLTIQNLVCKRDEIKNALQKSQSGYLEEWGYHSQEQLFKSIYHATNRDEEYNKIVITLEHIGWCRNVSIKGCSVLGIVTMAYQLSFQDKIMLIKDFISCGFQRTPGDAQLALLEKWERVIPKMTLWYYAFNHTALLLPELRLLIAQFLFDAEISLL
jgi:hypothetical protein